MTKLVERAKGALGNAKKQAMYGLSVVGMSSIMAMSALAAEGDTTPIINYQEISDKMVVSFNDVAASLLSTILAVIPVVMSILGAILCIKYGISFFQKMTGTATK